MKEARCQVPTATRILGSSGRRDAAAFGPPPVAGLATDASVRHASTVPIPAPINNQYSSSNASLRFLPRIASRTPRSSRSVPTRSGTRPDQLGSGSTRNRQPVLGLTCSAATARALAAGHCRSGDDGTLETALEVERSVRRSAPCPASVVDDLTAKQTARKRLELVMIDQQRDDVGLVDRGYGFLQA